MQPTSYRDAAEFRAELRRFLRRSEECAREHGITPAQHLLLLQVAGSEDGQSTVSDLVDKLSLTQSTVTELVQRAVRDGLLARRTSATDGRVVHLSLTPEGRAKLEARPFRARARTCAAAPHDRPPRAGGSGA